MRLVTAALAATIVLTPLAAFAQDASSSSSRPQSSPSISVPRLINLNGVFRPADGQPIAGAETVTFAIYADESGGTPIWQETQQVTPDASGRYTVLLGATKTEGVPLEVFASGEARWLGMIWSRGNASQSRRSRLTFVPYAVHATDADTLGGKPASAYVLTSTDGTGKASAADPTSTNTVLTGTPGQLAKYAPNGVDIMGATTVESGGRLGVGTAAPLDYVHAQFTDNSGGFTGFAVQNLSGGAAAYSGTLFYDNLGNLGQFQGFNNFTHEYRINNVAKSGPNFNGSINFMVGGTSRFLVTTGGNIGIGTAAPFQLLEVSNGLSTNAVADVLTTTYTPTGLGSGFTGRKAHGTLATPTAVMNGDTLASFRGRGHTGTTFSTISGGEIAFRAAENWTDAAQGTGIYFITTPWGGTVQGPPVMTINPVGDVGIGTTVPSGAMEISRKTNYNVFFTDYGGTFTVSTRRARGANPAAPTAALSGDALGTFGMSGYGATSFGQTRGGMVARASEDFTDSAQGTALAIFATPIGQLNPQGYVLINPDGKVGIDMPPDITGFPTSPLDTLQVTGDIRIGTAGTNGCVKDFSGTGILGTCSSDLRLKKDITPFGAVLDRIAALQPVHYFWRAEEFPERHFGNAQAAGLIAQDVEQVLPELVETDKDGFKAVNYSKLPLFTIQAVRELKTGNDALKAETESLKQRVGELEQLKQHVAELERLLMELRTATVRR